MMSQFATIVMQLLNHSLSVKRVYQLTDFFNMFHIYFIYLLIHLFINYILLSLWVTFKCQVPSLHTLIMIPLIPFMSTKDKSDGLKSASHNH